MKVTGNGRTTDLYYDPTGRLYRLQDSQTGQTNFLYDGNAMIAEYNSSGGLVRRYVHGSNVEADDPLVVYEGSAVDLTTRRFLHADPRGSIVAITNHNGTSIATNTYDEYGIPDTASGNDLTTKGRFRYTGQMWIPELEMYYYKARFYSYKLGRFLQTDPIGYEDQFNLYAYVANDPINGVDPMGLEREGILGGLVDFFIEDIETAVNDPTPTNVAVAVGTTAFKPAKILQKGYKAFKGAKKATKAAKKTCCFVAGTLVATAEGLRAIETIQIGDKVWARDEATGETALKAVSDLIERNQRVIWEVTLTGPDGEAESFETTDDHPWWIAGQGWKKTEELVAGMAVVTRDGRGMVLASVVETNRTDGTYNLTVADFETYFVGEQQVLVHNCGDGAKNRAKSQAKGIPDSKIGPSGKPKQHTRKHSSRKSANQAAAKTAKQKGGRVRNDANPANPKQGPHFQAEDAKGNNVKPVVHEEYPK